MSKILVIEPHRMLQQAISLSLFPDHEVQTMESIPHAASDPPKDFDLVILDAGSLREKNALGSQTPQWVQSLGVPILWVDNEEPAGVPKREKLFVIQSPLTKERLLAAVVKSVGLPTTASADGAIETDRGTAEGRPKTTEKSRKTDAAPEHVIELVDVVDEGFEDKTSKAQSEK